jgi:ABC-2 type transport system ATP-binding protein
MIDIKNLSFSYRREALFRELSLELQPGNIYGLLGVNGAGKSTLLKIMAGLLFANSGVIRSAGGDPAQRRPSCLAEVFLLPEELNLPSTTAREYLDARAPFYPRFDHDRFERCRREFELPQGGKLTALSYGQQKKFLLSFGLACQSALLLLDEPTNGLDIPSKSQFRRVIAEAMIPGRLVVIATHQVRDVGPLIDPIVVLHEGRVILNRSLAEVSSKIHMTRSASPPDPQAPGLLHSEQTVGGFWSVWLGAGSDDGSLELEVLFDALITAPERCVSMFNDGARA